MKPLKSASDLEDLIKEKMSALFGPWPKLMTLFVFGEHDRWTVTISNAHSNGESFYRGQALGVAMVLRDQFDLSGPRQLS